MRSSVVLPQPDGAEQREELALVDDQRQIVDGGEVAEPLGDVVERDDRASPSGSFHGAKFRRMLPSDFMSASVACVDLRARKKTTPASGSAGAFQLAYWPVTILVQMRVTTRCVFGS